MPQPLAEIVAQSTFLYEQLFILLTLIGDQLRDSIVRSFKQGTWNFEEGPVIRLTFLDSV